MNYRNLLCVLFGGPFVLVAIAGCDGGNPKDRFGRTYYIDGAGNWGFGVIEVTEGLTHAGYPGAIHNWRWSLTFNPALDQINGAVPRGSGVLLGGEITQYKKKHPDAPVNIIALSAGTGVAIWACEAVEPPARVHTVILLGSSLSSRYDVRKALSHIEDKIYVYYSRYDQILQGPVALLGTIDGTHDEPAGMVGLRAPPGMGDRIVNIGWSRKYERYGWTGAHTDCTSEPFVRRVLAQHLLPPKNAAPTADTDALAPARVASDRSR